MRITAFPYSLAILLASLLFSTAAGAQVPLLTFQDGQGSLTVDGRINARWQVWNWFEPAPQRNDNNDYTYSFVRTVLGLRLTLPNLNAYVEAQDVHLWGLPDDAVADPPAGPLGMGAACYTHAGSSTYSSTIIRQASVTVTPRCQANIALQLGRFDYRDGLEVEYANKPKVMWLKKMRLAERLVGLFAWSSFNRSFDGLQLSWETPALMVNSTIVRPTQGGFENDAHKTMHDIDLAVCSLTVKHDQVLPRSEPRLFYLFYRDRRGVPKVDNTLGGSGHGDIRIHTLGLHWLTTAKTGSGAADVLFWGVGQFGDWGGLSHRAWAATAEIGYHFLPCPWSPWVRIGYHVSSGDTDPADGDHGTFFQILPTSRMYALFPFFNQMNNEDLFIQAICKPLDKLTVRTDLHFLRLHEDDDLWYTGSGATRNSGDIFGYIGRPSFGDHTLGTLLDFTLTYAVNGHLSAKLYYGHAFGGDCIRNAYPRDDDGDMAFVEAAFEF